LRFCRIPVLFLSGKGLSPGADRSEDPACGRGVSIPGRFSLEYQRKYSSNGGGVEMADVKLKDVYPVPEKLKKSAWVAGRAAYDKLWKRSIDDPNGFWGDVAGEYVEWFKKWDKVMDYNFDMKKGPIYVKFFEGGKLNVSYNCLDRHLKTRGNKIAIQFEGKPSA
jgi:hypothetical protein